LLSSDPNVASVNEGALMQNKLTTNKMGYYNTLKMLSFFWW
jgi:hypothetical protein